MNQIPAHHIIVGDFNAHNTIWGSESSYARGNIMEQFINNCRACILNSGSSTHLNIASGKFYAIDLSPSDPRTISALTWRTLNSLYDSDHYPILITNNHFQPTASITKWRIFNANWEGYTARTTEDLTMLQFTGDDCDDLEQFYRCILSAAEMHIGQSTLSTSKKSVPWWNEICQKTV